MNLRENLTKENFFNEAMEKYPKATKLFCEWIDEYKKAVGWQKLFNRAFNQSNIKRAGNGEIYSTDFSTPKFHDLPYEMQQGIWIRFANETLNKYFEHPEYEAEIEFDLREDIKKVFGEINDLIDTEEGNIDHWETKIPISA
jgi:mRNA-degrading endonuclease HigB of HigAB toxin-antitoxin module